MGKIGAHFYGEASATGMVAMNPEPDYDTTGGSGFQAWFGCGAYDKISLQVEDLDGEVELQGCNGDPTVSGNWYTIATISADGEAQVEDEALRFVHVNVTTFNSGTLKANLLLEG